MEYASLVFYVIGTETSLRDCPWNLSCDPTREYLEVMSAMVL